MRYVENEWTFEREVPEPGKREPPAWGKDKETDEQYLTRMLRREDVCILLGWRLSPLAADHPLLGWVMAPGSAPKAVRCFCLGRGLVVLLAPARTELSAAPLPTLSVVRVDRLPGDVIGQDLPFIEKEVRSPAVDLSRTAAREAVRSLLSGDWEEPTDQDCLDAGSMTAARLGPRRLSDEGLMRLAVMVMHHAQRPTVWDLWRLYPLLVEQAKARQNDGRRDRLPGVSLFCEQPRVGPVPSAAAYVPVRLFPCGVALVTQTVAVRLPFMNALYQTLSVQEGDVLLLRVGGPPLIVYRPEWGCMNPPETTRSRDEGYPLRGGPR